MKIDPEALKKREYWNERYGGREPLWGREPNRFLAAVLEEKPAEGRALDLACGEGRNAIWLAARGWQVTAVDVSDVALERGRQMAAERGVEVDWVLADVTEWTPEAGAFDLVVILYVHVPRADRKEILARAVSALSPGGELLLVGHALRNLTEGTGGPKKPELLWEPEEVAGELAELGARLDRAEEVDRPVETEDGEVVAIDTLIRASVG